MSEEALLDDNSQMGDAGEDSRFATTGPGQWMITMAPGEATSQTSVLIMMIYTAIADLSKHNDIVLSSLGITFAAFSFLFASLIFFFGDKRSIPIPVRFFLRMIGFAVFMATVTIHTIKESHKASC